jgi:uncharacterized protein
MPIKHFLNLILAKLGSGHAALKVARDYFEARGVERRGDRAARWARVAADKGLTEALRMLGSFHIAGFGVSIEHEEAARLYRRAADLGDPVGRYQLGWCYFHACGVEKNDALAFEHWLEAGKNGVMEAQFGVVDFLLKGYGTRADLEFALGWCDASVRNEVEEAAFLKRRIEKALQAGKDRLRLDP